MTHPPGLQQVPLALHTELNVDQSQQVLLEEGGRGVEMERWWAEAEKTEGDGEARLFIDGRTEDVAENKRVPVCR